MLLFHGGVALGQCPNNNTAIAGGPVTPQCAGTITVPCVMSGQYVIVDVVAGNTYNFNTCDATAYDPYLTLYPHAGGGAIAFDDDACGLQSSVTWTATFTGQVRVLIDEYDWFYGSCVHFMDVCFPISISCLPPPPPVTNDNCPTAIALPVLENCFMQTFTNAGATNSGSPNPSCGYAGSARDVWFQFIAPASGVVIIETAAGTMTDGVMQLYAGSCGALTLVECDDDDGPGLMPRIDRRCNPLVPFANYWIRFWGYSAATGTFGICVRGYDAFPAPQEDCVGGVTICSSQAINNNANWTGCTQDLGTSNRGCLLGNERQGTWYFFSPQETGTIAFDLVPTQGGVPVGIDYDFAIWGPLNSVTCPPPGAPLRCSWAYPPNVPGYPGVAAYYTGMAAGAGDNSENEYGNGYVNPITVGAAQVGQIYIMYIDNFDITGQSFNMNWNLSSPTMLDCTVLPVTIVGLKARCIGNAVAVEWTTQVEQNTERFVVQHSTNGSDFTAIGWLAAAGNSLGNIDYALRHESPVDGINYYRLEQVDRDGTRTLSNVVAVELKRGANILLPRPNPATTTVQVDIPGGLTGAFEFRITDAAGRLVKTIRSNALEVPAFVDLPVAELDPGTYLVTLHGSDGNVRGVGRFMRE
jgi:hypothetical protein